MVRFDSSGSVGIGGAVRPLPQGRHRGWREVAYLRLANHRLLPLSLEDYWNLGRRGAEALPPGAIAWLSVQPWSLRARIAAALRDQRGAIAYDSSAATAATGFPGSASVGLNNAGGDAIFAVGVGFGGGGGTIASLSYGGSGLTADATVSGTVAQSFYGVGISTGNQTLQVTQSGVTSTLGVVGMTFSGVHQTTPLTHSGTPDVQTTNDATWTQSTTSGAMLVAGAAISTAGFHTVTAQGGATKQIDHSSGMHLFGLTESATGSSQTINATWSSSDEWRGCSASLAAAGGGGGSDTPITATGGTGGYTGQTAGRVEGMILQPGRARPQA